MAKVLDSMQRLPDGTDLVRWHLLDDNYQLIKPVERFLRFKQERQKAEGRRQKDKSFCRGTILLATDRELGLKSPTKIFDLVACNQ